MSRREDGAWNSCAGIDGLEEIRKYNPDVTIFFYIGDVKKAIEKLEQRKVRIGNIQIGQTAKEARAYLSTQMEKKKA